MNVSDGFQHLAALAGIIPSYTDSWGHKRSVPEATQRAILSAMGLACETSEQIEANIRRLEDEPWRRPLDPVVVTRRGKGGRIGIPLFVDADVRHERLEWRLELEHGEARDGVVQPSELPLEDSRDVNGETRERRILTPGFPVPHGYHRFRLFVAPAEEDEPASCPIVVVPRKCYVPSSFRRGGRSWGYALQLYALRSERNWGIGDFTDLTEFARLAAQQGAAAIGLNPLHAMFPENPAHHGPYSPSHRQFLAYLYIDPEAVPEFAECEEARNLVGNAAFREEAESLQAEELVDYERVAGLKRPVLELLYGTFRERHLGPTGEPPRSDRGAGFRRFQRLNGQALENLGRFHALCEHFGSKARPGDWPAAYRDPEAKEVHDFARRNRERVEFFHYLQWVADQQLTTAAEAARDGGCEIGLYHDLALAPDGGGAEAWGNRNVLAAGVALGAPPDDWNLKGQNWGLPPYSPVGLRAHGYQPFIDVIRANMRNAGALRLDHAMWLERMYWIPDGANPHDGGYVRYPVDDLMGILALESQRQRCLVIAEDLGTVPEGFRDRMRAAEMMSYRLLFFSSDDAGEFLAPKDYVAPAAVAVSTHDLATLAGFWKERDLNVRAELGLYPSEQARDDAHRQRAEEKRALLRALKKEGILSSGFPDDVEEFSFELVTAVHRFLARTPCRLLLVSLEDAFGETDQVNLPGTTTENPNWKRKVRVALERFADDPRLIAIAAAISEERGARSTARGSGNAG